MNKKVIILILGGLILIAAIIYFIFIFDYNKSVGPNGENPQTPAAVDPTPAVTESPIPSTPTSAVSPEERSRDQVSRLALSFAERFGTSSSQSDFSNLEDLKTFMTEAFKVRIDAYISAEQAKAQPTAEYNGIVTKAVMADVRSYDEASGTSDVIVRTRRQEQKDAAVDYDQSLKLSLKRSGTEWLVDSAEWLK